MKPFLLAAVLLAACSPTPPDASPPTSARPPAARPSILLVTLDTTRADALGVESGGDATPHLDALAARGERFAHAYSTVPTTLPAHASMLTGLYPAEHGVHENARYLARDKALLAERLGELGYATAAFVSGFPLDARFGLARGFDHYDDDFAPAAERPAGETTSRALTHLEGQRASEPLFLWVHYFDPHDPYEPPEPFRSRYPSDPYLGEIAYMDSELGRLVDAFERRFGDGAFRIVVAGDHGEGLGDHGEAFHGNLLYQGVMRVPLIVAGAGVEAGVVSEPVSIRGIFDTVLRWAEKGEAGGLLAPPGEVVLGEAMKPHLQYGWRPQVMAVRGPIKVIQTGETEIYDVEDDPDERDDLAGRFQVDPELRRALTAYPSPPPAPDAPGEALSQADRERLASLGYVDWGGRPAPRDDAPAPKDMTHLFADLDSGSRLFVEERYDEAAEVFERLLEQDPHNLMVAVRLAAAHSVSGREKQAEAAFARAREIDPASIDVRFYHALHHLRAGRASDAEPLLESVLAQDPGRLPALEALARIRERQGLLDDAAALLDRASDVAPDDAGILARLGELRMAVGDTAGAIAALEGARASQGERFGHCLELGVLYLADRRPEAAAECLDRVPPSHPGYPMALFKRAQVAVLLAEPDRAERIRLAAERADATTRPLIENETLFRGVPWR